MFKIRDMKIAAIGVLLFALGLPSVAQQRSERTPKAMASVLETEPIEISAYDSCIRVKNAPIGSLLEIYSVVGINVKEIKIKEAEGEYPVHIPKGYYIIRIGDTVRKVVIR